MSFRCEGTDWTSKVLRIRLIALRLNILLRMSCSRCSWTHVIASLPCAILHRSMPRLLPLLWRGIVTSLRLLIL